MVEINSNIGELKVILMNEVKLLVQWCLCIGRNYRNVLMEGVEEIGPRKVEMFANF